MSQRGRLGGSRPFGGRDSGDRPLWRASPFPIKVSLAYRRLRLASISSMTFLGVEAPAVSPTQP